MPIPWQMHHPKLTSKCRQPAASREGCLWQLADGLTQREWPALDQGVVSGGVWERTEKSSASEMSQGCKEHEAEVSFGRECRADLLADRKYADVRADEEETESCTFYIVASRTVNLIKAFKNFAELITFDSVTW